MSETKDIIKVEANLTINEFINGEVKSNAPKFVQAQIIKNLKEAKTEKKFPERYTSFDHMYNDVAKGSFVIGKITFEKTGASIFIPMTRLHNKFISQKDGSEPTLVFEMGVNKQSYIKKSQVKSIIAFAYVDKIEVNWGEIDTIIGK